MLKPQMTEANGINSDGEHLSSMLNSLEEPMKVILDVGAQVLELDNFQVAQRWLAMTSSSTTQAVLFFNDKEELLVLARKDRAEALQISPFSKRLHECLVYLDEAHTRGTDLKLSKHYRAAVTLRANLTKDRLVQACMRMRKPGKGQSVVFCIPEEIQTKADTWVPDVIVWAMKETCTNLSRSMPLWANRGRRYEIQKETFCGVITTKEQVEGFLEDEAQTLEKRYCPCVDLDLPEVKVQEHHNINGNLRQIDQRCRDLG